MEKDFGPKFNITRPGIRLQAYIEVNGLQDSYEIEVTGLNGRMVELAEVKVPTRRYTLLKGAVERGQVGIVHFTGIVDISPGETSED